MKKALCISLVIVLLIACFPGAYAASVSDFIDVGTGDWFYSAVEFVTGKGMFAGTSASTFSPYNTMTRGMFVTVLGRYGRVTPSLTGENSGVVTKTDVNLRSAPTTSGSTVLGVLSINARVEIIESVPGTDDPSYTWYYVNYNGTKGYIRSDLMTPVSPDFEDVPPNEYYAGYVYWAYTTGIAEQTGMNTFSPNVPITREEICSMLYRYAEKRNYELRESVAAKSFSDSSEIRVDYAAAVSAMQRAGVVNGYDDGTFNPKGSATRAEVSAMLSRFVEQISYKPITESSVDGNGSYIWGTEVPQYNYVNSNYFTDACFIGHSLVVGMKNNFGLSGTDFFAYNGAAARTIQAYGSFEYNLSGGGSDADKATGTLSEALSEKNYGKVYIMLGANEAGVGTTHEQAFYSNMSILIDMVRLKQPNAKIYLFSLTSVSQDCSENRADLSRDNIIRYNALIKTLCREKRVYYLNVFDLLINTDGFLPGGAAMTDGIHLLAPQYAIIKDYVFCHAV